MPQLTAPKGREANRAGAREPTHPGGRPQFSKRKSRYGIRLAAGLGSQSPSGSECFARSARQVWAPLSQELGTQTDAARTKEADTIPRPHVGACYGLLNR